MKIKLITKNEIVAPLLAAVESVPAVVTRDAEASEQAGTLTLAIVAALRDAGLFALKLPRALGGAEADPVTQMEVLEALARIDMPAAWCTMVCATGVGLAGAFVDDAAVEVMFHGGRIPTAAIVGMPGGRATRIAGGYRLSGRWPFASGVRHAEWVALAALVEADGAKPELRYMVVPGKHVRVHSESWDVVGLQATGSCDVSVDAVEVLEGFTWNPTTGTHRRGGPLYRLRNPGFVANEHVGVALGAGRAALDALLQVAKSKRRGVAKPSLLDERGVFQRAIGTADLKLRAARALALERFGEAWSILQSGSIPSPALQAELRAVATLATDAAVEAATVAFRYTGGTALQRSGALQRHLRDLNAAAQHYVVSDITYETHGMMLLGLADVDPLR